MVTEYKGEKKKTVIPMKKSTESEQESHGL